jgi:hypothetical protein
MVNVIGWVTKKHGDTIGISKIVGIRNEKRGTGR